MLRIITDSASDINQLQARNLNIDMGYLKVQFGNETFIDQINLTSHQFYNKLATCEELPTTTLVNPQDMCDLFNKYPDEDILGIFLAGSLSGTFQSAVIAKGLVNRDNIYLIDSNNVTAGLAILVKIACDLRDSNTPVDEIVAILQEKKQKLVLFAAADTLKYLVKGGRLSAVGGLIGGALAIKPILKVENGIVENYGKTRGMKKGIKALVDIYKDAADESLPVAAVYSENHDNLNNLLERLPNKKVLTYAVGSVVGTHIGPGAVGIAFFKK